MTFAQDHIAYVMEHAAIADALRQEADKAGEAAEKADKVADDSIEALLSALQKACPAVAIDALTARKLAKEAAQKADDANRAWVKALDSPRPFMSSPTQ